MNDLKIDLDALKQFERTLDPKSPESGVPRTKVLGYGEISSVLQIDDIAAQKLAFKRMPMFETEAEVEQYAELVETYQDILVDELHVRLPANRLVWFWDHRGEWIVCYIIQEVLDARSIGSQLLHSLNDQDISRLFAAVLGKVRQVFAFNSQRMGRLELGFDGQISNWAVADLSADRTLPEEVQLIYFDTSSPLLRLEGVEKLNTELFLRSAPSFLRGIVRALFLEDVVTRYYDMRKVVIDLLANLYKEDRGDLIPSLLEMANTTLLAEVSLEPISIKEVRSYYREDAFIWRLYLSLRKLDRYLFTIRGRPYPFILPEKVRR